MKKTLASIAAMCGILGATAQESIHLGTPMASPVINDDNTATFSLKANPGAEVSLVGNVVSEPVRLAYDEQQRIYTFTTGQPLAPALYTYHFEVDGARVLDPGNTYMVRDISSIENYFIIKGDADDTATLSAVGDVPHGTVSRPWYHSDKIGRDRRLSVYTPAGYENSGRRYPVLYLLHGSGGDENAWLELGRTAQILDNLIASGKAEPMIVVMPSATLEGGAAPGDDERGHIQPIVRWERDMNGEYEEAFPEIVDFIDTTYRTLPDPSHRAIAGLSMGGFHAKFISAEYPEMFGYVGLFSAAMGDHARVKSPVYADEDTKLKTQFAGPLRLYWIGIGEDDFLYDSNRQYRAHLDKMGLPYEYHESKGGHQWVNWRDYLNILARKLFK